MSVSGENTPEFNIAQSWDEFEALENKWNRLFEENGRGPQLFQSFNWVWHWINQYPSAPKNLIILTGHIDDELVIIAPLVIEKKFGIKIIKWLGEPVSQYGDILIKTDINNIQWLNKGLSYLKNKLKPDLFYMRKTRFDAAITPLLENFSATVLEETQAPYIEILGAKNFTDFNKRYSQRSRKSKRRHRRKLEEKGKITFSLNKEGNEAKKATMHALRLKREWLKAIGMISPAFNGPILDRFFTNVAITKDHATGLRVSQLCVDDRPAAIELGFQSKNYYGAHLGAYEADFIAHSPGSLQMQDTIASLINEGIQTIDLFAPGDPYKFEWTDQSVPVYDFSYPISMKGHLFEKIYLKRLRPALKSHAKSLSDLKKSLAKKTQK